MLPLSYLTCLVQKGLFFKISVNNDVFFAPIQYVCQLHMGRAQFVSVRSREHTTIIPWRTTRE